ncbi:MAG: 5-(carboxyamino)imidazole ribonucleotide mutase [Spirochaetes bacterium]|nr:MAG: 5-(carboxyamino)imidazole ribonucleotide mutase [Spirochaetota bacterium]
MPDVAIILGSDSDLPRIRECFSTLEDFGVPFEVRVSSAHRTPDETKEWAKGLRARGVKVVIAAAGGAAHLPGVLAAYTTLPVIGIPIETALAGGIDSILSILQMPSGIPVGTMPAGRAGGTNAALYAVAMLAIGDAALASKLDEYRKTLARGVMEKNEKLQAAGYKEYIRLMESKK